MLRLMSRRVCMALHGARELSLQGVSPAAQRLGLAHTPLLLPWLPPWLPPALPTAPCWSRGFAAASLLQQRLPTAACPQRSPPLYLPAVSQLPAAGGGGSSRGYAARMKAKSHPKGCKMKLPSSFKEVSAVGACGRGPCQI